MIALRIRLDYGARFIFFSKNINTQKRLFKEGIFLTKRVQKTASWVTLQGKRCTFSILKCVYACTCICITYYILSLRLLSSVFSSPPPAPPPLLSLSLSFSRSLSLSDRWMFNTLTWHLTRQKSQQMKAKGSSNKLTLKTWCN